MLNKTKLCRCIAASLIVLTAGAAHGEDNLPPPLKPQALSQTIYKGVVGTVLDEVPIDSERRVELQRGSAVISNTFSGRSLAVMLGVSNPVFMAVGLAWGLFAASKINAAPARLLCRDVDTDTHHTLAAFPYESLPSAP